MILDEIAAKTKERVAEQKKKDPLEEMKRQALDIVARETDNGSSPYSKFPFKDNLAADGISFICEVKKASPSKGLIAPDFPYVEIAKEYEESIPEFAYRLKVKAGLTGYAQIYGKYNTTAYDKLKLDLMYIESYSILEDLKLILATFKIVFTKESTEGLEEGQTISLNAKEEEKKDV